ncbi:amino acid-binding protein [Zafaria sp. J156]|uniref:amino acid-binding protein n=1 Tax=Zafaria sp. J156 TaxID=3116490 RepID=UPI002E7A9EB2|nr:amino acid-binding protein [Zafaria sp. J156]MEE1622522.1 amino acid-binding protein [Zafaria sp. J156]
MVRLTGRSGLKRRASPAHPLACSECGQLPEPERARRTVALVAAVLPVELAVHAALLHLHLPFTAKVLLLTITATALAIWVAEPSAARLLRGFLHAPHVRRHEELHAAQALWRLRFGLPDRAGALERVTHELAVLDANILSIHVHPLATVGGEVLDELVVSAPAGLAEAELLAALRTAGTRHPAAWPTTPLSLADAQTRSLGLAARVAADPDVLPEAVAELLSARVAHAGTIRCADPAWDGRPAGPPGSFAADAADGEVLRLPTATGAPLTAYRPGEPFTPAESSRAHRLAELAEAVAHSRGGRPGAGGVLDSRA